MPPAAERFPFAVLPEARSFRLTVYQPIWAREVHTTQSCEMLHVVSGRMELAFGGRRFRAAPGDTLLMPPRTPHRDLYDLAEGLKVFLIFFTWAPEKEFFRIVDNSVLLSIPGHRQAEIARIVDRLRHDVVGDTPVDRAVASARVHTILLLMLREALLLRRRSTPPASAAGERRRALVARARKYVEENYHRPISLEDIARALGLSAFYLSHLFSEESDFTLFHYLTALRMDKAKELLTSGLKVTAVARQVGYEDGSYFSRVFRKYTGVTPAGYRRRGRR